MVRAALNWRSPRLHRPETFATSELIAARAWQQALPARAAGHTLKGSQQKPAACAGSSTAEAQEKTLKVVMHPDLKSLDPVWSGAYIVRNHGYLVYDTQFALDANFQVQPQMAQS